MKNTRKIILISSILLLTACGEERVVGTPHTKNDIDSQHAIIDEIPKEKNSDIQEEPEISNEVLNRETVKTTDIKQNPAIKPRNRVAGKLKSEFRSENVSSSAMKMHDSAMGTSAIHYPAAYQAVDREKYSSVDDNGVKQVLAEPVSTFSIDVDTASYANVRRLLNQGVLPRSDAVRVEELINYFSYDYPQPKIEPFSIYTEVGPSPWSESKYLLHIGIQGKKITKTERPASNLVFLIDVSGSMRSDNKIGLLKNALKMMSNQLDQRDHVGIVVYAGAAGTVLKPTSGDKASEIKAALNRLTAGGSTNGGAGIQEAYQLAQQNYIEGGINRVILATDGDFNVGTVNQQALKNMIEDKRKSGVSLSVLGFGMGNYNDALMQELAQNGNGNAYYIDTLNEARKVLVEELSATLMTIAKDVKIQVEFNPNVVAEYRLVGYETRALNREDFNNDKVDAGDIGAGHTVTAIYELSLKGSDSHLIDPLRYQKQDGQGIKTDSKPLDGELAFLRLRYKQPNANTSQLIEIPVKVDAIQNSLPETSDKYRFSAAVAAFGQILRGGKYTSTMSLETVIELARKAKGSDSNGYRGEFINIVKLADALTPSVQHF